MKSIEIISNIQLLEQAISEGKQVSFKYQGGKDTEATPRQVHAWMVANRKDTDYLIGHQEIGGTGYAIRQYKVESLEDLEITDVNMSEFPTQDSDPSKWDKILVETTERTVAPVKE